MVHQSISSFEQLFCFLFSKHFVLVNLIFLAFELRIFHFLLLFWMLCMRVTVNKPKHMTCHEPYSPQITTHGIFVTEFFLVCPMKKIMYWSHVSCVIIKRNINKNLWPVCSKTLTRRWGRKRNTRTFPKLFVLSEKAKIKMAVAKIFGLQTKTVICLRLFMKNSLLQICEFKLMKTCGENVNSYIMVLSSESSIHHHHDLKN